MGSATLVPKLLLGKGGQIVFALYLPNIHHTEILKTKVFICKKVKCNVLILCDATNGMETADRKSGVQQSNNVVLD